MNNKIAIIGGGAFGTALASVTNRAGHDTLLFLRDAETATAINETHENPKRLPGVKLPEKLRASCEPAALVDRTIVLFAVPAQQTAAVAKALAPYLGKASNAFACAKGLERDSGRFQHQILEENLLQSTVFGLSGPGFATDIANSLPTALTLASARLNNAQQMARKISTPHLRLYASDDVAGVETGGALKNVLAIAVGAVRGMALGASAEAALIARGFAELRRLGLAMGARDETLMGLSGLGDLVLTCSSPQSRNFSYGFMLGKNSSPKDVALAEGVHTARTAAQLAERLSIDAPIIQTVAQVVDNRLSPQQAVEILLSRPLKSESG